MATPKEDPANLASSHLMLPLGMRSRRGSVASISSRSHMDKDVLSQALDEIHSNASKTVSLTTFNDYGPPPPASATDDRNANAQASGFGIYSRFKSSINASREKFDTYSSRPGTGDSSKLDSNPLLPSASSSHNRTSSRSTTPNPRLLPPAPLEKSFRSQDVLSPVDAQLPATLRPPGRSFQHTVPPQPSESLTTNSLDSPSEKPSLTRSSFSEVKQAEIPNSPTKSSKQDAGRASDSASRAVPPLDQYHGRERKNSNTYGLGISNPSNTSPGTRKSSAEASSTAPKTSQAPTGAPFAMPKPVRALSSLETDPAKISSFPKLSRSGTSTTTTTSSASTAQPSPAVPQGRGAPLASPARPSDPQRTQSQSSTVLHEMRRKILSRDFWMKDENAKACFRCGDGFSTFRRKHHCRTCGQIYDSKCTVLTSGRIFGQASKVRVCKTCEAIINGDDSSDYTDDDAASINQVKQLRFSEASQQIIPGSPTNGSAVGALRRINDPRLRPGSSEGVPSLARPSSSRSLKSLSSRPRSSGHHRHRLSKHQHMRGLGLPADYQVPFQPSASRGPVRSGSALNLQGESIIDPELAPFMSDDGSSDDELPSIASNLHGMTHDQSMTGLSTLSGISKRSKHRGSRSLADSTQIRRDLDAMSITSSRMGQMRRHLGMRSLSTASFSGVHGSPRVIRSQNLNPGYESPVVMLRRPSFPATENRLSQLHDEWRPSESASRASTPSALTEAPLKPPAVELNSTALNHVNRLMVQFLADTNVPNARKWTKTLVPLYLQCAQELELDIAAGDSFDLRNYIKIKKAPGGKIKDSTYIQGVVFTKNLAWKEMPRQIKNPRILLLAFPITYDRAEPHFMTLEPVIAQEKEYLRNLVNRIKALNPSLVLVQKQVAGLALQYFQEAGIAVACNVKESVMRAIARCSDTRIVLSVDRLTMHPNHLGRCADFSVKTLVHNKVKQTYICLSGCLPDRGCTILLRGAGRRTLRTVKYISEFMCYMVWNLRLETCLLYDEFGSQPASSSSDETAKASKGDKMPTEATGFCENLVSALGRRILSISPFVKLEEPYLLLRGVELEQQLQQIRQLLEASANKETDPEAVQKFELVKPGMLYGGIEQGSPQIQEALRAIQEAEYDRTDHHYQSLKRRWENYAEEAIAPFDPVSHQHILALYSTVTMPSGHACDGPDIAALEFYADVEDSSSFEGDYPLGEFVETACHRSQSQCLWGRCESKMVDHQSIYVHGDGQVTISLMPCPSKLRGMEDTILMWSTCRKCDAECQVSTMSPNTWKYSFGKYLELTFWSLPIMDRTGACPHDIHKDHLRYFGFKGLAVCVKYDPINILEVQVPRARITWKVDKDLSHKNEEFMRISETFVKFLSSVKARIRSIKLENLRPEKFEACKQELAVMMKRVGDEQDKVQKKLQEKYLTSKHYEIIPLNRAVRMMQEDVAAWDAAFADFEKNFFPSEHDIRKLAKSMYLDIIESREDEAGDTAIDIDDIKAGIALATEKTNDPQALEDIISEKMALEKSGEAEAPPPSPSEQAAQNQEAHDYDAVQRLDLATASSSPSGPSATRADIARAPLVAPREQTLGPGGPLTPVSSVSTGNATADGSQDIGSPVHRKVSSNGEAIVSPPLHRSQTSPTITSAQLAPLPTRDRRQEVEVPKSTMSTVPPGPAAAASPKPPLRGAASNFGLRKDAPAQRIGAAAARTGKAAKATMQSMLPQRTKASKVVTLTKHFEQISREFEKVRAQERLQRANKNRQARVYPMASYKPVVEIFRDVNEAVRERAPSTSEPNHPPATDVTKKPPGDGGAATSQGPASKPISRINSPESSLREPSIQEDEDDDDDDGGATSNPRHPSDSTVLERKSQDLESSTTTDPLVSEGADRSEQDDQSIADSTADSQAEITKQERSTLMKMLNNFWSERSASGWTPLEYPLSPTDHLFQDADIIVREDEPTSLIALALASRDYQEKLQHFRQNQDKVLAETVGDEEHMQQQHTSDAEVERTLLGQAATHVHYKWDDEGTDLHVRIFFAESFDAIRRKCGVADRFVETMSRCIKWDSKGGKTRSIFLKTLDERFIIKSLSEVEKSAFMNFAPDYFDYLSRCLFHGLPSGLAKILGFYQVTMKNPVTKTEFSHYLLVMENVFYEGPASRAFDLKGSMRNRRIQSTGESSEVLLDENLLDYISESPIYIRNHSERLMQSSINNDTLFCAKQNVMDYSLIAGIYDERAELVVGIIDYIRTYTWDKKLESWIKDRGRHRPTVRSPKEYRNRFKKSIPKYFPTAPSPWQVPEQERASFERFVALGEDLDEIDEDELTAGDDDAYLHDYRSKLVEDSDATV